MKTLAVFAKYFGYNVGGAERSVIEMMKAEEARGHRIVAGIVANASGFGATGRRLALPSSWEVREFRLPIDLVRFRFVDYAINKAACGEIARQLGDADILYAYGTLAPAVINASRGKTVYLVRDEYGLGWNVNYYRGMRRVVQSLYHASESPLRALWRRDLKMAIRRSHLIANSRFIADELYRVTAREAIEIAPPHIDRAALSEDHARALAGCSDPPGVVVIGDNVLKGGDIVRRVAMTLPNVMFYVFDRRYPAPKRAGNLVFMPWQSPGEVYSRARVVMVPSRCAEAFSRAVLEAQILRIPVVASTRGGIPEAIDDQSMLVADIDDVAQWTTRLVSLLENTNEGLADKPLSGQPAPMGDLP